MLTPESVDLARLQFAVTAFFHFLFVPLSLGLSILLAIMETVYVVTGQAIYRTMVKFWGKLFGINFVLGVASGLTLEFQFGANWAYFSHYAGDIFGMPLAIEAWMAFFLESTFIGLFFFGWERLSPVKHLMTTYLVALGASLSGLWILVANGWMQNPVGTHFNPATMRLELTSFYEVFFNPDAQAKFVHTISAGYLTGSLFVLGISAWYLLKGREIAFARRSFRIAAAFGFASALSVIVLGDESGYTITQGQKTKLAALEAIWHTEPPPAGLTLFALPDESSRSNRAEIKLPYLLGLIATRSATREISGLTELEAQAEQRIRRGITAVSALERLRRDSTDQQARALFEATQADLGYGLLLKRHTANVTRATPEMIRQAAADSHPRVAPMFWSFRVMVVLGFSFLALFAVAFWHVTRDTFQHRRWLLRWAWWFIPLPWVASELGWFIAEYGRQPWAIYGVLPTYLSASALPASSLYVSLTGYTLIYAALLGAELFLIFKTVRRGPHPDIAA